MTTAGKTGVLKIVFRAALALALLTGATVLGRDVQPVLASLVGEVGDALAVG